MNEENKELEKIIKDKVRYWCCLDAESNILSKDEEKMCKSIASALTEAGYCKVVMGDGGKSYDVYPEANKLSRCDKCKRILPSETMDATDGLLPKNRHQSSRLQPSPLQPIDKNDIIKTLHSAGFIDEVCEIASQHISEKFGVEKADWEWEGYIKENCRLAINDGGARTNYYYLKDLTKSNKVRIKLFIKGEK